MKRLTTIIAIVSVLLMTIMPQAMAEDTPARNFLVSVLRQGEQLYSGDMNGDELARMINDNEGGKYGADPLCIINIDLMRAKEVFLCKSPATTCLDISGANVTLNLRHRTISGYGTMFNITGGSLTIIDNKPSSDKDDYFGDQGKILNRYPDDQVESINNIENEQGATIIIDGTGTLIYRGGIMSQQQNNISNIVAKDYGRFFISAGQFYQGLRVASTDVTGRISGGGFNSYYARWKPANTLPTGNDTDTGNGSNSGNETDTGNNDDSNASYIRVPIGKFVHEGYDFYKSSQAGSQKEDEDVATREASICTKASGELFWIHGSEAGDDILTLNAANASSFSGYEPRVYKQVRFLRSFGSPGKWYSFHVPFTTKASKWKGMEIFKNSTFSDIDSKTGSITVVKVSDDESDDEDVVANTPYYVRLTGSGKSEWSFTYQDVKMALPEASKVDAYTFVCNYSTIGNSVLNDPEAYYYYINDGKYWKRTDSSKDIPATRWYFYTKDKKAQAKGISFIIDEPTQMHPIRNIPEAPDAIFTLDGRRVNSLTGMPAGIYIVNGVKVKVNGGK